MIALVGVDSARALLHPRGTELRVPGRAAMHERRRMSDSAPTSSAILVIDTQVDLIQGDTPVYNGSAKFGAEDGFGNGEHEIVTRPCFEIDFV